MMNKLLIPIIMFLMVFTGCKEFEKEILIPASTIQQMIDKKFPIEKRSFATNIRLSSPKVFFQDNNIGLSLQYSASVLKDEIDGNMSFTCKPVYKPESADFYLNDFVMTEITWNNESRLENDKLMGLISSIMNSIFKDHPLYKLNQDDYKQNLAKMVLKNVTVRGNNLVLLLSL
jgi:hypothetical protein